VNKAGKFRHQADRRPRPGGDTLPLVVSPACSPSCAARCGAGGRRRTGEAAAATYESDGLIQYGSRPGGLGPSPGTAEQVRDGGAAACHWAGAFAVVAQRIGHRALFGRAALPVAGRGPDSAQAALRRACFEGRALRRRAASWSRAGRGPTFETFPAPSSERTSSGRPLSPDRLLDRRQTVGRKLREAAHCSKYGFTDELLRDRGGGSRRAARPGGRWSSSAGAGPIAPAYGPRGAFVGSAGNRDRRGDGGITLRVHPGGPGAVADAGSAFFDGTEARGTRVVSDIVGAGVGPPAPTEMDGSAWGSRATEDETGGAG